MLSFSYLAWCIEFPKIAYLKISTAWLDHTLHTMCENPYPRLSQVLAPDYNQNVDLHIPLPIHRETAVEFFLFFTIAIDLSHFLQIEIDGSEPKKSSAI
jgi:hypothetical protein